MPTSGTPIPSFTEIHTLQVRDTKYVHLAKHLFCNIILDILQGVRGARDLLLK